MRTVDFILPEGVDDPTRPSGGNLYDLRMGHELRQVGWIVREHQISSRWPNADAAARDELSDVLASLPRGRTVIVDGLTCASLPDVLGRHSRRLRLVILVHMPLAYAQLDTSKSAACATERSALSVARSIICTSSWTMGVLRDHYRLDARVHVVTPGVGSAPLSNGTTTGTNLLSVGAVTPIKGHDLLLAALNRLTDISWRCLCVGALDIDPTFSERLRRHVAQGPLAERVTFTGPLTGPQLDDAYANADLLVLASRVESYGMVIVEALARGVPVLATRAGGTGEALGNGRAKERPGVLVERNNPAALADELRLWLTDDEHRKRLREAAVAGRSFLPSWRESAVRFSRVLAGLPM